jgi:hypothetical protein
MTLQEEYFIKCGVLCASSVNKPCYFCWYDFEATNDEQTAVKDTELFREKSINIWYKKLGIDRITLCIWSPTTPMHILHDCFRSQATTSEMTLKLAVGIFPEGVAWLKPLIRGTIPSALMTDDGHRVYKSGAGVDRTTIWHHRKQCWFWSQDWPIIQ